MTYQDCVDWLFSQLPMYQRSGPIAYKADIGNIVSACEKLNNPHLNFKSIHIAGTNGKGSTSHMIASILQEAGYKTALYTSPHLRDFRERIRINGQMIDQQKVVDFVSKHKDWFSTIGMSFFEMTVALAFYHFSEEKVDIAVIETGLGGRLDSTNIITPELSVITNIGLDHTNLLGDTLEKIAVEKAGIIKENVAVVLGRKQEKLLPIFKTIAQQKNSNLILSELCPYPCDLMGQYQNENKSTAYTAIQFLKKQNWKISEENISNGLNNVQKNTSLLGRWTILNTHPKIVCDTAHNEDGLSLVIEQIKNTPFKNLHMIFGVVNDKTIDTVLQILPKNAWYYFCQANIPRALNAKLLKEKALSYQLKGDTYKTVLSALNAAKKNAHINDFIFVGGSTFTVAEIL